MRKIMVFGKTGQLAQCIESISANYPDYEISFFGRNEIDLNNRASVDATFVQKPDLVINTAAYTSAENAENDKDGAYQLNAVAPEWMAENCSKLDIPFIHISTDYVFSGPRNTPWNEDNEVKPVSVYGASKMAGELAVQKAYPKSLIIRTSWLFSTKGNNFVKTMLRLGSERDTLAVIDDQIGLPTCAHDLAEALMLISGKLLENNNLGGIYHFANSGICSWYDFAAEIFNQAEKLGFKTPNELKRISTAEYKSAVARPEYSVLNTAKIKQVFGITPREWRVALSDVLQQQAL